MKREAILLFGPAGTGKSYALLSMVRSMPSRRFYVLDTDEDWEVSTDGENLPNLEIIPVGNWESGIKGIAQVRRQAKEGDWICPDMLDTTWDYVQNFFIQEVFHEDMADYYLELRRAMKDGDKALEAFDGWKDWNVINRLYSDFWRDMLETPCHIFATAKAKELAPKKEDKLVQVLSAPYGVKPDGQKRTAHRFHTILMTGIQSHPTEPGKFQWHITTYRERWKRKYLSRYVLSNFFLEYGISIAKWGEGDSSVL